eukprot:scaffold75657_cov30-Tisochrysis_lutea.AAC.1
MCRRRISAPQSLAPALPPRGSRACSCWTGTARGLRSARAALRARDSSRALLSIVRITRNIVVGKGRHEQGGQGQRGKGKRRNDTSCSPHHWRGRSGTSSDRAMKTAPTSSTPVLYASGAEASFADGTHVLMSDLT